MLKYSCEISKEADATDRTHEDVGGESCGGCCGDDRIVDRRDGDGELLTILDEGVDGGGTWGVRRILFPRILFVER